MKFKLQSEYRPAGDQPQAIEKLVEGVVSGVRHQVLLGVTGSGKTFTIANVIARLNRPTLIIAHNKTLAGQLYGELKQLFPDNAVEYFVSYYDYYQPEAYVPEKDLYVEKEASINDDIDRLRHRATTALLERRDVIIVASVSCIYGLGSPDSYSAMLLQVREGEDASLRHIREKLVEIRYEHGDYDFRRGKFRVRGGCIDVFPSHEEDVAVRIRVTRNCVEKIFLFDPLTGRMISRVEKYTVYPATHYVAEEEVLERAVKSIEKELEVRLKELRAQGKLLEAQRLEQRTRYDLELLRETGYCPGIENYSRHFTGRRPGEPPPTLLDYFPPDFLTIVDESHMTIPQLRAMYEGDRTRKMNLVEYGFRLPSALDNRPLKFEEWEERVGQVIFVSATPGDYELYKAGPHVVEQIVRPTGLIDPQIEVRPAQGQVDDLVGEIRKEVSKGGRVLVTTLTKRMAENLTDYLSELGIKVHYLHSEVDTLERLEIVRDLRKGVYDVIVGINLLREGLDIPEVTLVAVLDADREGFLRSDRSLIQVVGRAARNVEGRAIFYADIVTQSMQRAIEETERRRRKQIEYNTVHGITPQSIKKHIHDVLESIYERDYFTVPIAEESEEVYEPDELEKLIERLQKEMKEAADLLEFERAASIRDRIRRLKQLLVAAGEATIIIEKHTRRKQRTRRRKR